MYASLSLYVYIYVYIYRLKQREAKVKADDEAQQVALKERIQSLLAEKERQTYKYMRQTRKRDDLGATIVDGDGDDEAGDVSIFTHDNTSTHQRQKEHLIHTNNGSHAASEGVGIAPPLPSDMPLHPPIYSDKHLVNTTDTDNHTPVYDKYGTDYNSDADSDSLDEESSPSIAVQTKPTTVHGGTKHIHDNNDNTNTTAGSLSSTEVTPTLPVATSIPEPEPLFQMVMSIDDLRRKRPKQLLPSAHSSTYTPDSSTYMPSSSTHMSPTSAKSASVPLSYPTTSRPAPTHSIDPTTSSSTTTTASSRRPSTHQGRLSTDSSTSSSFPTTALNKHHSPPYIPHASSNSVRSSRDQATTHTSPTAYTDTLPDSPSQTLHIPPDPTADHISPPSPSNLHTASQLASTSTYSNNSTGMRAGLTSVRPKPKNKKGFRRLSPIPLRPYQPV